MGKATKVRTEKQLANDQRLREVAIARAASRSNGSAHQTRAQDMRESEDVHDVADTPWVQGGSLLAPKPRAGYVQRWIRVAIKGKDDAVNVSRKFREGWKPRAVDTMPSSFKSAKMERGQFAGYLMVEGSVLCEMPAEKNRQRKQFMRDLTDKKTRAIDAELKRVNEANRGPGFGEIQKSSRTIPVREVRVQREESEAADL